MRQEKLYDRLFKKEESGVIILFDPDRSSIEETLRKIDKLNKNNMVKAYFIGSSFQIAFNLDEYVKRIKENTDRPVIMFPSSHSQLSRYADAVLYMSLISGRNPHLLIGEQLRMVPFIVETGIEAISTGYILIDGGKITSVEFMSNTKPIPRDKAELVAYHAKAAELFGFKLIYLEAGSGAIYHVPFDAIKRTTEFLSIPVIAGGGFVSLRDIEKAIKSGAKHIVVGTAVEKNKLFV